MDDLELIFRFCTQFGGATEARGRSELSALEKEDLEALAKGELPREKIEGLVPLLAKNEVAMEYLAEIAG